MVDIGSGQFNEFYDLLREMNLSVGRLDLALKSLGEFLC